MSHQRPTPHGTRSRYARGCRCDPCREASRLYHKRLRERRLPPGCIDSTGTSRRLQSLHAIGWAWPHIAARLGTTDRWPSLLANAPSPTVTKTTAVAVDVLYRELSCTPGPSVRARTWSAKHGWVPPAAWDDDAIDDPAAGPYVASPDVQPVVDTVAVERAIRGHRVALTELERHHAVHVGRQRGMVYHEIATVLHISFSRTKALGLSPLPDEVMAA